MFFLMLLTIGCGPSTSSIKRIKLVKLPNIVNSEASTIIDNIVLDMNERASEVIITQDDNDPKVTIAYGPIDEPTTAGHATCYTPTNNCDIIINSNLSINNPERHKGYAKEMSYFFLETLIRHEIGHTFGMDHIDQGNAHIMNASLSVGNMPSSYPYNSGYVNILNIFAADLNNQRQKNILDSTQ